MQPYYNGQMGVIEKGEYDTLITGKRADSSFQQKRERKEALQERPIKEEMRSCKRIHISRIAGFNR